MNYGKFIDKILIINPQKIVLNHMQIFNPKLEHLLQAGYKEIRDTDIPEDPAPEGQHYEPRYEDMGDYIGQVWELKEDSPSDVGKTIEQRVTTLEQGMSSISAAIERGRTE